MIIIANSSMNRLSSVNCTNLTYSVGPAAPVALQILVWNLILAVISGQCSQFALTAGALALVRLELSAQSLRLNCQFSWSLAIAVRGCVVLLLRPVICP